MGVRRNAKFLSASERESLVRAFVLMKADIANPGAPPADRYSRWDELVAVHRMIQSVDAPTASDVNFGHGGAGAFSFLSWHRYLLFLFEQRLQSYVPGVMLPYWDWTDPSGTILTADFLGPNGDPASSNQVRQGYFAAEAPGTGINLTPSPAWWPAGLTGWNLHPAFGTLAGALRRNVAAAAALPSVATLQSCLGKTTYPEFQNALESGAGTVPFHQLHNGLHGWFGAGVHMATLTASPFDPMFYLHHCNIDRLWAMWQADGHASEYPDTGGDALHHRNDPMFPWVGGAGGYTSDFAFPPIVMPDFSALGVIRNVDVLDYRAFGYTYDTLPVVGISLDRTGSMNGLTPDPMISGAPDVTKWVAATRGVSAFLQDCEAAHASAEVYVTAGVKTFRRLFANEFTPVFGGTPYGLVKSGGAYSRAVFDATIAAVSPGGSTPLADALSDTHTTLVAPPFGGLPADERRYLALFTDGLSTSGSPLSSIPDGSLARTAVFAMGFGTAADVDYPTLDALKAKGLLLPTQQVFHGENAGVIDKFYSQALAAAIGFSPVLDPVLELYGGEHAHLDFTATSAEETFFVTAQGMDFDDSNWSYQLIGPDGEVAYADGGAPAHAHGHVAHATRRPLVTARRGRARLSLFLQRDSADDTAWVGSWQLLIAYKARTLDAMMMPELGDLLVSVAAGPVRGPRYARLLMHPARRVTSRSIRLAQRHRLDVRPISTNSSGRTASSVVVNISARTRLRVELVPEGKVAKPGTPLALDVKQNALRGSTANVHGFGRLVAPSVDLAALVATHKPSAADLRAARVEGLEGTGLDHAILLARLEARRSTLARMRDEELAVVSHHGGPLHLHVKDTEVPGVYHAGVWLEGVYDCESAPAGHQHGVAHPAGRPERFTRLLSISTALPGKHGPKSRARGPVMARRGKRPR
jgi:hypothetical protein